MNIKIIPDTPELSKHQDENQEYIFNYGVWLHGEGRFEEVISTCEPVVLNPKNSFVFENYVSLIGDSILQTRGRENALEYFEKFSINGTFTKLIIDNCMELSKCA